MTDIEYRILENQEISLLGLSKILTPYCKGMLDNNGETTTNNKLIDAYHLTRKILNKTYIKRW